MFQQLVHFLLDLRSGLEAAKVLVHAVEPHRLGFPVLRGGHDELRFDVVILHGVAWSHQREIILVLEGENRAVAVFFRGHRKISVVNLVVQILVSQHTDLIHFLLHGLAAPERHDVVEVAAHGRDVLRVGVLALQQRVGEAFLVGQELHLVADFEAAEGDHLLSRAPVNHVGGCGIVAHHEVGMLLCAVVAIDNHVTDLAVGRQRVVIDDDGVVVAAARVTQHSVSLMVHIMAEAVFLHAHGHAVIEGHAVVTGVGVGFLRGGCQPREA